jgi:hypothetical protein
MNTQTVITIFLASALLFGLAVLMSQDDGAHILWNRQGYAPEQPIAFSHRLHAGELQVDCRYCHFGAETSRHAGFPAASVCMNCHRFINAPLGAIRAEDELATSEGRAPQRVVSEEIQKIYDALALGADLTRDEARELDPIEWIKIHRSPDYVYFDHRPHVAAGVECQRCHGAVESMERVRQAESLSMGWCVNCHRQVNETGVAGRAVSASLDCSVCHY